MHSPPMRCRIGLRHYRRPVPWAPSAQAVAGALDIYSEGRCRGDTLLMLFGLSILRSASAEQVEAAVAESDARGNAHTSFTGPDSGRAAPDPL